MSSTLAKRGRQQLGFPTREPFLGIQDLEDVLTRFWHNGNSGWLQHAAVPSLDLSETDKAVDARMDIPGVKAEDIDVQVHGNLLTVSAERKEEKEEKGRTFHRIERSEGTFSRTVTLPCEVDGSNVNASYQNGVLTLSMPKLETTKSHKVQVKAQT